MDSASQDGAPERHAQGRRLVSVQRGTPVVARDPYAAPGYGPPERGDELAQSLGWIYRIIVKRRWLIAGVTLLALAVGTTATLLRTPLYISTVRIQIDREPAKIVEGGSTMPSESGTGDFLKTQYELLKSLAMAERVVSTVQLHNDQDFIKPRGVSLVGYLRDLVTGRSAGRELTPSEREAIAVDIVSSTVVIRPVPGSRLVDIAYSDPKPVRAQRIANAYAEAFIASNIDKRFQSSAYAKSFLEDQIKQLKLRLEDSEREMLGYAEREKIIEVTERTSVTDNNLQVANSSLGQLVAERIKNEQLWKQVDQATGMNLPQLLSNGVIEGLRVRRNTLVTEYEEKLETFKPSYPSMIQIQNKIREVERQLSVEVQAIKASLRAAYDASLNQEAEMLQRIEILRTEVLELQKKSIQYNILKREVDTNRSLYLSLLQRYKEVDIAGGASSNNVLVVDKAHLPSAPSEPILSRALLLSLFLGLGSGLGLAFLLEKIDDRIRSADELEQLSNLTTLGIIPMSDAQRDFASELSDPHSAASEAYRSLATSLQFSTETGLPRSLSITSATAGEGKSTTALAIARHFANMGLRVLLVDADLRKPSLHEKLDQDNSIGLTNYLTGAASPPDVIQSTTHPNLAFLPSGPLPPNAADLLGGTRMYSLVSVGLEVFDFVVIDAPPMLGLADAALLSNATSATLFVVAAGQPRKGMIAAALRRLNLAKCNLIGVVLTRYDASTSGYGYSYGYGYGTGYGPDAYTYGSAPPASASGEQKQLKIQA